VALRLVERDTAAVAFRVTIGGCSLDADALERRRAEWAALEPHRAAATPLADGFAIIYRGEAAMAEEVRRLAAAEGGCCGFATWDVAATGDGLVLTVTGPEPGIGELRDAFLLTP